MIYGKPDGTVLWTFINHARQLIGEYAETPLQIQSAIRGPLHGHRGGSTVGNDGVVRDDPDNHHYEAVTRLLPEAAYRNPKWLVNSRSGETRREYLRMLSIGLDRWAAAQELFKDSQRSFIDYYSGWCSSVLTMTSNDRLISRIRARGKGGRVASRLRDTGLMADINPMDEWRPRWPKHVRKNILDLVWDMDVDRWEDRRWSAHRVRMDRRELLAQIKNTPGSDWDIDAIMALPINVLDSDGTRKTQETGGTTQGVHAHQEMIEFWEMHVRGYRTDDADNVEEELDRETHGTLFTVAQGAEGTQGGLLLRPGRPYTGPRTGAHHVHGAYWVGDSKVPLSQGAAVESQVRDLNNSARAIRKGAENYRRIVLYDPMIGDKKRELQISDHDHLVPFPNLMEQGKPAVVSMELGGITAQMLEWHGIATERLQRVAGHTDSDSGQGVADLTATVGSLAAMGASARRAGAMQGWHQRNDDLGRGVAHYLVHDEGVAFELQAEDAASIAQELGMDQPGSMPPDVAFELGLDPSAAAAYTPGDTMLFRGGSTKVDLEELGINVSPLSMSYRNEGQRLAELDQAVNRIVSLLPTMAQTPDAVNWGEVMELYGSLTDTPQFSRLVDVKALGAQGFEPVPTPTLSSTASTNRGGGPPSTINLGGAQRPAAQPSRAPAAPKAQGVESA